MTRLFLIRHGETDFNFKKIVQGGGIDSDLNAVGKEQGKKFFQKYYKHPFQAIYASGLKRTYQTLSSFEKGNYAIQKLPGLNEMSWGELEGQPFDPVNHAAFLQINEAWASGKLDEKFPGGESPREVWARAGKAIQKILQAHANGDILICSHGRTIRIILCMLSGYGLEKMNWFPHENTGLNILQAPEPEWFIEKMNCLEHLQRA